MLELKQFRFTVDVRVRCVLFNLNLGRVTRLWKTSCIVRVPEIQLPTDLSGKRTVALTSHLMKTLEGLVLAQLRPVLSMSMDPLQYACQLPMGVHNAVILLWNLGVL